MHQEATFAGFSQRRQVIGIELEQGLRLRGHHGTDTILAAAHKLGDQFRGK